MTRKDYQQFADMFNAVNSNADGPTVWHICVAGAAEIFAADNPRFDRRRFFKACGVASNG